MDTATGLWDLLAAGGGTLALTFIVGLALGLLSLTILFVGSAVVVLERFARVKSSPLWIAGFGILVAASLAAMLVHEQLPELSVRPWSEWLDAFAGFLAWTAGQTAVAIGLSLALLRFLSPTTLARGALVWLALVTVLYVGALGRLEVAVTPAAATGLLALGLALWRRRGGAETTPGELERTGARRRGAAGPRAAARARARRALATGGELRGGARGALLRRGRTRSTTAGGGRTRGHAHQRRVVHRGSLPGRQAATGLHLGDHGDLHHGNRRRASG